MIGNKYIYVYEEDSIVITSNRSETPGLKKIRKDDYITQNCIIIKPEATDLQLSTNMLQNLK